MSMIDNMNENNNGFTLVTVHNCTIEVPPWYTVSHIVYGKVAGRDGRMYIRMNLPRNDIMVKIVSSSASECLVLVLDANKTQSTGENATTLVINDNGNNKVVDDPMKMVEIKGGTTITCESLLAVKVLDASDVVIELANTTEDEVGLCTCLLQTIESVLE
ncbi:hypothetical protein EPUS_05717 [Endocarpon pusillum Z07020]|uniref:Uncharacterized protein n=1 Tax=Endocarpon pusillum (strain Z07020 / HMAS-L-300199) TaxID=1263415 RepID=U1GAG6_ENDPU|nr:uncharacterized protein EPUS_05717 [Endocarpon pusillum Z07020]ERF68656.1 hypothetical protein EPUS_05717 [Endocarpon pusillum Z07020]